jgi:type II secretory pathway pseudopilin PulG
MTRVEVLVLIVGIGLLSALALMTLQRSSEGGGRRGQCMNKLRQIGIALQGYHEVHRKLPATSNQGNEGGVASVWWPEPGEGATSGAIPSAGYSWIVMILPYMDEEPLYNAIADASGKFSADAFTPYNVEGIHDGTATGHQFSVSTTVGGVTTIRHFATVPLDELACPSYAGTATVAKSPYTGKWPGNPPAAYGFPAGSENLGSPAQLAAVTNYVALSATHFPCMQYGPEANLAEMVDVPEGADAPNGMIAPGNGLPLAACKDGTSKTLMVCETIEPAMNCWYDGTTAWTTGINPNTVETFPPDDAVDPKTNPKGFWTVPPGGKTALNVGPSPDTEIAYSPALESYCDVPQVISWGPSSNHANGVVVHLAVDGSVHLIAPDIDPTLYMHLITIAGSESDAIPDTVSRRSW